MNLSLAQHLQFMFSTEKAIPAGCDLLKAIVDQCNALKICMEHLADVVEDFLNYDT